MSLRLTVGLAAVAMIAVPPVLSAQEPWDAGRIQVTRADLESLAQRLDSAASSETYSHSIRDRARNEAAQIRKRLAEGDFQVGDRISLVVEGEQALSDTFSVRDGRVIRLPTVGDISLAGVLRSELESHLRSSLGKFIKDPVVRARSLIRLSLLGEVAKPGFYSVPTDMVLSDALMLAGGPSQASDLKGVRIERSGQRVWADSALQAAIAQGRTLDQLDVRAGDQVVVPKKKTGFFNESTVRTVTMVLSIPVAIFGLVSLLK